MDTNIYSKCRCFQRSQHNKYTVKRKTQKEDEYKVILKICLEMKKMVFEWPSKGILPILFHLSLTVVANMSDIVSTNCLSTSIYRKKKHKKTTIDEASLKIVERVTPFYRMPCQVGRAFYCILRGPYNIISLSWGSFYSITEVAMQRGPFHCTSFTRGSLCHLIKPL